MSTTEEIIDAPTINNIFELSDLQYSSTEDYTAFYIRFRAAVCKNLKKTGSKIKFLEDTNQLLEDEILSPTFEEVVVLWCLEKIDHSLPRLANQTFGAKLIDDVTLKDLQEEIFKNIPDLLGRKEVLTKSEAKKDAKVESKVDACLKEEGIDIQV